MARPRSAGFELQREQMLAAAAQLFASRGYTAATMQDLASACGVSKATLYHYVRDKHELLLQITQGHVQRLEAVVNEVVPAEVDPRADPRERLSALVLRFMQVYASAQHEHRVLTEDVKFLDPRERDQVLACQRRVVQAFADSIGALRPDLQGPALDVPLDVPLAMLLFGMMNWTFTWLRPSGGLTHESLAAVVLQLLLGGLPAVQAPAMQPAAQPG
jgi:TetR/AcrR family transcriptional regulator